MGFLSMSAVPAPPETAETPVPAPETPAEETETQLPLEGDEGAAPEPEAAAELQVSAVEPEKPQYVTREEFEQQLAAERQRAAAEALELDRRRRQTENARKAAAEQRAAEERAEARDAIKAAFGASGVYEIPDETVYTAIERVARKQAQGLLSAQADTVDQAFDYIVAPVYGQQVDLEESFEPAARKLAPKVQSLIDTIRPQIEAEARKGWISEAELPARVEAEIARRNAKKREPETELQRVEGQPANNDTLAWWNGLSREERQNPANIARFDAYTSRL